MCSSRVTVVSLMKFDLGGAVGQNEMAAYKSFKIKIWFIFFFLIKRYNLIP